MIHIKHSANIGIVKLFWVANYEIDINTIWIYRTITSCSIRVSTATHAAVRVVFPVLNVYTQQALTRHNKTRCYECLHKSKKICIVNNLSKTCVHITNTNPISGVGVTYRESFQSLSSIRGHTTSLKYVIINWFLLYGIFILFLISR